MKGVGLALFLYLLLTSVSEAMQARELPVATVEDAIAMVRIHHFNNATLDGAAAAISPDGRRAAAVIWQGDLKRNVNVYSLIVFDLEATASGKAPPRVLLKRDFTGDPNDNFAAPFSSLTFLNDSRTIAFLGREGSETEQVYTVSIESGMLRQWTRHPTAVRSYAFGPDGNLRAFSAVAAPSKGTARERLEHDGVFMWERDVFPTQLPFFVAAPALWNESINFRQFFLIDTDQGGQPRLFFDSRQGRPAIELNHNDPRVRTSTILGPQYDFSLRLGSMTVDPSGRYLLMFPYALTEHPMEPERYSYYANKDPYERRMAAPAGLVDLTTGRIERLIDAPVPLFGKEFRKPLWVPGEQSILLYTLEKDNPAALPRWVEVDIATRRTMQMNLPKGWSPISWKADGRTLILMNRDGRYATIRRMPEGKWRKFVELRNMHGFSYSGTHWQPATNGDIVIGISQSLMFAPEFALFDLSTKRMKVLTDLNPELRQRRLGKAETFRWKGPQQDIASGFLIKPVDYRPGTRYPLVILLDDGLLGQEGEFYLLDAAGQLSAHAIQMLAAHDFMVLYTRDPQNGPGAGLLNEGEWMRMHIESAVATLDSAGLIDTKRVGISGWSRAAYHTNYLLSHSPIQFAAASAVDGGMFEYSNGMRSFYDEEIKRICTPLLIQAHGLATLVGSGSFADRLEDFGKATEILYFANAPHDTRRPRHRLRSLGTHIDWWRFWLKGEEDSDPAKRDQYAHWRQLRKTHEQALQSCPPKGSR